MKKILLLFILFIVSCTQKVSQEDLSKLNGYWEIKTVERANGEKKEYKINPTIDFFSLKKKG